MALIKCKKCGKEVSDKAIKCPHCETILKEIPVSPKPEPSTFSILALIGIILTFISLVYNFLAILALLLNLIAFAHISSNKDKYYGLEFTIIGSIINTIVIIYFFEYL